MRTFILAGAVLGFSTLSASAQETPQRAWLDVNIVSMQPSQAEQTYASSWRLYSETAAAAASYPGLSRAIGGQFNGGLGFGSSGLGLGVQFKRAKWSYDAGLAISIPHPLVFNRSATDADVTGAALDRTDTSVDFQLNYVPKTPSAVRVRLFGGPTLFHTDQDMVSMIRYEQATFLTLNAVNIASFERETASGSAWGLNAGADVAWFFSRYVGVGGGVQLNKGTVTVDDPLTETAVDLNVGATTVGAGLRLAAASPVFSEKPRCTTSSSHGSVLLRAEERRNRRVTAAHARACCRRAGDGFRRPRVGEHEFPRRSLSRDALLRNDKNGTYMSQQDAVAAGNRPAAGRSCS